MLTLQPSNKKINTDHSNNMQHLNSNITSPSNLSQNQPEAAMSQISVADMDKGDRGQRIKGHSNLLRAKICLDKERIRVTTVVQQLKKVQSEYSMLLVANPISVSTEGSPI